VWAASGWSTTGQNANLAQLGWNTEECVDVLWSLSRATGRRRPPLCATVRLAEALGDGWGELNTALATDRGLRGRLFGVLGSSLALGDHLVANPQGMASIAGQCEAALYRTTARCVRRVRR